MVREVLFQAKSSSNTNRQQAMMTNWCIMAVVAERKATDSSGAAVVVEGPDIGCMPLHENCCWVILSLHPTHASDGKE